jgi:hypothetical protein
MTTVIEFIGQAANLCDGWESGDRLPPNDDSVSDLIKKIDIVHRSLASIDMGDESVVDQAAALGVLSLLASLKVRIEAIAADTYAI